MSRKVPNNRVGDPWREFADKNCAFVGEKEATRMYHMADELEKLYEREKRALRQRFTAYARHQIAEYIREYSREMAVSEDSSE